MQFKKRFYKTRRFYFFVIALPLLYGLNAYLYRQYLIEMYMRWQLRNQSIIVSFTTTPTRINKIESTVATLLKQNISVDALYLCIPHHFKRDNSTYAIPKWLSENKKIKILRTQDYGPGTKLLGVLEKIQLPSDAIVITVDDDVYYPKNLFLQLAYAAKKNPQRAVGIFGVDLDYVANGVLNSASEMGFIKRHDSAGEVDVLQGIAGIAYKAQFFKEDIFNLEQIPSCKFVDDMYFSFYLAKNGFLRYALKNDFINVFAIDWHHELGLGQDALHKQDPKPVFKHQQCLADLKNLYPNVQF